MCVLTCVSVCLCAFRDRVSESVSPVLNAGMIAKERREENRCGGQFESLWRHTCAKNTHARARSLSPLACRAALTTLYLHMCVYGQVWETKPPTAVQRQHIVYYSPSGCT